MLACKFQVSRKFMKTSTKILPVFKKPLAFQTLKEK